MKRAWICVLAVVALAACKPVNTPAPSAADTAQNLHVEIGRYGVMLGQTDDLTAHRPGTSMADPADPKELARALRETVWRFNVQRSELCGKNLFTDVSCGPALEPVWMAEPADAAPALDELQQRSHDVGEQIQKFWGAICDDARRAQQIPAQRQMICAIE